MSVSYQVRYVFNDGSGDVILPIAQQVDDPKEGDKSTVIEGTRGNGSLRIPGGLKSQIITIKGTLLNHLGYANLIQDKITFQNSITTNTATLTAQHFSSGWQTDYAYTVFRQGEIKFGMDSQRTDYIEYTINFFVLSY
jgi:hypothetical protein